MDRNTMMILFAIGLFILIFAIRYIVRAVVNKGVDAVSNAIADKKNKTQSNEPENLADRFKK